MIYLCGEKCVSSLIDVACSPASDDPSSDSYDQLDPSANQTAFESENDDHNSARLEEEEAEDEVEEAEVSVEEETGDIEAEESQEQDQETEEQEVDGQAGHDYFEESVGSEMQNNLTGFRSKPSYLLLEIGSMSDNYQFNQTI